MHRGETQIEYDHLAEKEDSYESLGRGKQLEYMGQRTKEERANQEKKAINLHRFPFEYLNSKLYMCRVRLYKTRQRPITGKLNAEQPSEFYRVGRCLNSDQLRYKGLLH